jgi:small subunit ribosomal protein S20
MNKAQKNRKLLVQNKRNRMINRRYTSTIKTLSKLCLLKKKECELKTDLLMKEEGKKEIFSLVNRLYSIIDKATKKAVIHKNTASRKKARFGKLFSSL